MDEISSSTKKKMATNCTCGDQCQCDEEFCRCQASSVLNSFGLPSFSPVGGSRPASSSGGCHSKEKLLASISISGMSCQSCVKMLQSALDSTSSDWNAKITLGHAVATVSTREEAEVILREIEGAGEGGRFKAALTSLTPAKHNKPCSGGKKKCCKGRLKEDTCSNSSLFFPPDKVVGAGTTAVGSDDDVEAQPLLLLDRSQKDDVQRVNTCNETTFARTELIVKGMTCAMCTKAVTNAIEAEGASRSRDPNPVQNVNISLATNIATVDFDSSVIRVQEIKEAIETAGYEAEEVPFMELMSEDRLEQLARDQARDVVEKKRAFLYSLVGSIPICILTMIVPHLLPSSNIVRVWLANKTPFFGRLSWESLLLWAFATPVQFVTGWPFYRGAYYGLAVNGILGMDVLVAVGTTASYGYALTQILVEQGGSAHFFETSAVLISFILLGKWMQTLAIRNTGTALTKLLQLQSKTAILITPTTKNQESTDDLLGENLMDLSSSVSSFDPTVDPHEEEVVPIQQVHPGHMLKILRGASIPADGTVIFGEMSVDESMITGESVPVLKSPGSVVLGGTLCVEGEGALIRVTGVGSSTALAQIVKLVQEAQSNQVPIQSLADTISAVFVPTVCTLSVLTFLVWYALCNTKVVPPSWYEDLGENCATFSLLFGIACLVISCPCALGLATPTAVMVGTGVGASNGILMKGGAALEQASKVDSVVFDKTGTLTRGKPIITDFVHTSMLHKKDSCGESLQDDDEMEIEAKIHNRSYLLWLLGSLERNSEHPLAAAVVEYVESSLDPAYLENTPFAQPSGFRAITGRGAAGVIHGNVTVEVGNRPFADLRNIDIPHHVETKMTELETAGKTAILASVNGHIRAVMGVADELKPDGASSITHLRNMGIDVWMVTGDNNRTAQSIAKKLNLPQDRVIAEALPVTKMQQVTKLQSEGHIVAMVGDGINDSPALAQSDCGISLGTGAEIAAAAADMVLVRGHVRDVCTALDLSKVIFSRIKLNFLWSLLYNCLGIPVAAGVFFPLVHSRLPPTLAAVAMALSSLSVVSSSLALRCYKPPKVDSTVVNEERHHSCYSRLKREVLLSLGRHRRERTSTGEDERMQRLLANEHEATLEDPPSSPRASPVIRLV